MKQETKAMIESYLRNLLGQLFAALVVISAASGVGSPIDFGASEWLLTANVLWTSAIPTAIRWLNEKDPAFGKVAESVALEVSEKIQALAAEAKKKEAAAKKAATKKAPAKTTK